MFDIDFFKSTFDLKKEIITHKWKTDNYLELFSRYEQHRNIKPYLFSIETTNNCNMTCVMCPRTTEMNRKIENMDLEIFKRIAEQISPQNETVFNDWVHFIEKEYDIRQEESGENAFYFFISSKAVTMHGFGEPLFDPLLRERIEILSKKDIPTYFSCNPSNIDHKKIEALFLAGLKYIKFSVDSMSDEKIKEIRGSHADYSKAEKKILQLLDIKKKKNYPATVVLCMIKLNREQDEEAEKFLRIWKDKDVYAYIKSQDNRWYFKNQRSENARSHYESQYCEFPWTSLSVMVDGTVVPCTQDFNCEMPMGNIMKESLEEIWNSEKYKEFRIMHIRGEFPKNYRCKERCDLKIVSDFLR